MQNSRAVICHSSKSRSLSEIKLPPIYDTQVLIRTKYSGVSTGTDKWVISGRFEWGNFEFPLVPGYQRTGIVEKIGAKVRDIKVGQQVFATASINFIGATAGWGAHSQYAICEEFEVFDATGIPLNRAAFGVVAQVGFNAASRIDAKSGEGVIIVGDGVIGASGALCAKARGFRTLLLGRHDLKLAKINQLGISTANSKIVSQKELADFNPTAIIDTVQSQEAFEMYYRALPATWAAESFGNSRVGIGQIIYSGHSPDGISSWADMAHLQKQELSVHFVSGWTKNRINKTLELMKSDQLSLEKLATEYQADDKSIQSLFTNIADGKSSNVASYINWE